MSHKLHNDEDFQRIFYEMRQGKAISLVQHYIVIAHGYVNVRLHMSVQVKWSASYS
jgi:hypothetical protein